MEEGFLPLQFPRIVCLKEHRTTEFNDLVYQALEKCGLEYHDDWRLAEDTPEGQIAGIMKYRRSPHRFCDSTPFVEETYRKFKACIAPFASTFRECSHIEAIEYMSHMSTSSGFPNNGIAGQTMKWAREHADLLELWWNRGPFLNFFYSSFSKIEIRLKEKDVRQINAGDVFNLYVQIRLFKYYAEATLDDHVDHVLIGWDPYYGGWADIETQFVVDGKPQYTTCDMVNQDSRLCEYVLGKIYQVRKEFGMYQYSELALGWLKYSERYTIRNFIRMRDGRVFVKYHGMPSGSKMTSRDDSEYSLWCVLFDQVANNIEYPFYVYGDNAKIQRNFEDFVATFERYDLNVHYTNEEGTFLGRVTCVKKFGTGYELLSFLPSQFDKHICNVLHAKVNIVDHLSGIVNLADLYAMSYIHWKFFNVYYDLVLARLKITGRDRAVREARLRMKTYPESLALHTHKR